MTFAAQPTPRLVIPHYKPHTDAELEENHIAIERAVNMGIVPTAAGVIQKLTLTNPASSQVIVVPPQFKIVELISILHNNGAAVWTQNDQVTFNNDTATDYYWQSVNGGNVTASAANGHAQTFFPITSAGDHSSGTAGISRLRITMPFNPSFNTVVDCIDGAETTVAVNDVVRAYVGWWAGAGHVNTITVTAAANMWIAGSTFILYGIA